MLLRAEVGGLDDLPPLGGFGLDVGGELIGRARHDVAAFLGEPRAHL